MIARETPQNGGERGSARVAARAALPAHVRSARAPAGRGGAGDGAACGVGVAALGEARERIAVHRQRRERGRSGTGESDATLTPDTPMDPLALASAIERRERDPEFDKGIVAFFGQFMDEIKAKGGQASRRAQAKGVDARDCAVARDAAADSQAHEPGCAAAAVHAECVAHARGGHGARSREGRCRRIGAHDVGGAAAPADEAREAFARRVRPTGATRPIPRSARTCASSSMTGTARRRCRRRAIGRRSSS